MKFYALAALISMAAAVPHKAAIEARAIVSDTIAWPSESRANGNINTQYQITPLGSDSYKVEFFNSSPLNSDYNFVYTMAAVGTGNDGTKITKTLTPQTASSTTVQKSGTQVQFTIDWA